MAAFWQYASSAVPMSASRGLAIQLTGTTPRFGPSQMSRMWHWQHWTSSPLAGTPAYTVPFMQKSAAITSMPCYEARPTPPHSPATSWEKQSVNEAPGKRVGTWRSATTAGAAAVLR